MANKAYYNDLSRTVRIMDTAPNLDGYEVLIEDIGHEEGEDPMPGAEESTVSHVVWHHVRDALYHKGVLDMQSVRVFYGTDDLIPPKNLNPSILTGNALLGSTFSYTDSIWEGADSVVEELVIADTANAADGDWEVFGEPLTGNTVSVSDEAAIGKFVRVRSTATNGDKTAVAYSESLGPIVDPEA